MKRIFILLLSITFFSQNFAQSLNLVEQSEPISKKINKGILDWNKAFAEDESGYYFHSAKTSGYVAGTMKNPTLTEDGKFYDKKMPFDDKRPNAATRKVKDILTIQYVSRDLKTITKHKITLGGKSENTSFSFSSMVTTSDDKTWFFYSKTIKNKGYQLLASEFSKIDFSLGNPIVIKEFNSDDSYSYRRIMSPDKSKFCYFFYNPSVENNIRYYNDCEVVIFNSSLELLSSNKFVVEKPVGDRSHSFLDEAYPLITNGMPNNYSIVMGLNMVLNNDGDFFMFQTSRKKFKETDAPSELRLYAVLNQTDDSNKIYKDFKKEEFDYQSPQVFISEDGNPYVIIPYHSKNKGRMVLEGFHYYTFDKNLNLKLKTDNKVRSKYNEKLAKEGFWKKPNHEKYWQFNNLKHSYNFKNGNPLVLFEGYYHTTAGNQCNDVYMFQLGDNGKIEWAAAIDKQYPIDLYGKDYVGLFIDIIGEKLVYILNTGAIRDGKGVVSGTVDYDGNLIVKNVHQGKGAYGDFMAARTLKTMKNREIIGMLTKTKNFKITKFKFE